MDAALKALVALASRHGVSLKTGNYLDEKSKLK
jgi:hypothetical protein